MKWIASIILLIIFSLASSPATAESDKAESTDQPYSWSRFWQDVKNDWVHIGSDAKESGTEIGRSVSDEFKEMPENFREGIDEAKQDFQKMSGVGQSETEN